MSMCLKIFSGVIASSDQVWTMTNTSLGTELKPITPSVEKWLASMELGGEKALHLGTNNGFPKLADDMIRDFFF